MTDLYNIKDYLEFRCFIFHGQNIGKIDDCSKNLVNEIKKADSIDLVKKYSDDFKKGEFQNMINENSALNIFSNKTVIIFNLSGEKVSKEIVECKVLNKSRV